MVKQAMSISDTSRSVPVVSSGLNWTDNQQLVNQPMDSMWLLAPEAGFRVGGRAEYIFDAIYSPSWGQAICFKWVFLVSALDAV